MATEKVTCTFTGATGVESCRTTTYGPACNGTGSCTHQVSSYHGNKLAWQSSCGGTATTIVDGADETVAFTCAGISQVTDQVTCLFTGSTGTQTCSSIKGSCQGILSCAVTVKGNLDGYPGCNGTGSCAVKVSGKAGQGIQWKGTCGGYAYTIIDGKDEDAGLTCK